MSGERRLWLVGAGVLLVLLAASAYWLAKPRDFYTGTNSVRTRSWEVGLNAGQRLCLERLRVPAGTGRIQLDTLSPEFRPLLDAEVRLDGGKPIASRLPAGPAIPGGAREKVGIPIPKTDAPHTATLCVRSSGQTVLGGMAQLQGNDVPPLLDGQPVNSRVAVWYLPPAGEQKAVIAQFPTIAKRVALLRPGWVGPWTYWLIMFAAIPLLAVLSLRLLVTAERRRRAWVLPLAVAGICFAHGAVWATITPAFQAPDEVEHFAYVQYLAETGKPVARFPDNRPPYSGAEVLAIEATRYNSVAEQADGKPPWDPFVEREWRSRVDAARPPSDNGGGFTTSGSVHTPTYYEVAGLGYRATEGHGTFAELWSTRLVSSLLGALAALSAFLIVRELAPRRILLQVAAGLLVAWQPMFAFIAGAVNNDSGVNAAAALLLLTLVRILRRGLTPARAVALGALLVVLPLAKGTGYSLWPVAGLAMLVVLWRNLKLRRLPAWIALAGTALALQIVWTVYSHSLDRTGFSTPGGGTPGVDLSARANPAGFLSYLWQLVAPPLPFMTDLWQPAWPVFDIYVVRAFASFGWYSVEFTPKVYYVIVAVLVGAGLLGILTAVRRWPAVRERWAEIALLIITPIAVISAVEAVYYTPAPRIDFITEMGRYVFPAIAALAALAAGSTVGAGRRAGPMLAVTGVMLMIGFAWASLWLALAGFFT